MDFRISPPVNKPENTSPASEIPWSAESGS
jgi:hypothetical protein